MMMVLKIRWKAPSSGLIPVYGYYGVLFSDGVAGLVHWEDVNSLQRPKPFDLLPDNLTSLVSSYFDLNNRPELRTVSKRFKRVLDTFPLVPFRGRLPDGVLALIMSSTFRFATD